MNMQDRLVTSETIKCPACGLISPYKLVPTYDLKLHAVEFVFECTCCGKKVPIESWSHYKKTGDIVIKRKKEKKK